MVAVVPCLGLADCCSQAELRTSSLLFCTDPPEVTIEGYDNNWYLSRNEAVLKCSAKGNPAPTELSWST